MDQFRAMNVFVRVADRRSFSQAAADLGLSHGMASSIVKELETRLGVELIRRTTRRMALTDEGQIYYESASRVIDDVADMEERLAGQRDVAKGSLVVQAPTAFTRIVLGPSLGGFLAQHRNLKLSVLSRDQFPDLIAEAIDVLLYVGPVPESGLVAKSLGRFPILTVAAPSYLARRGEPLKPDELAQHDLINITSATSGKSLDWRFFVAGKTVLRPVATNFSFESSEAAIAAAIGGAGIVQNISYALVDHVAVGRLKLLLSGWREAGPELHFVTRKYRNVPARLRVFSSFLRQLVSERRERDAKLLG
jgi:LysR family transcriptional regulator, regulator for bpeEF and oprC